ncbi:hypothetical protein PYCC9005_002942 [Savitreella phatthalungensis]
MLRYSLLSLAAVSQLGQLAAADEINVEPVAASQQDASTPAAPVELPTFTPTTVKAPFVEQFADAGWSSRWSASQKTAVDGTEELNYNGNWAVEAPTVLKGMEGDEGLVLKDDARRHAISAKFDKVIDPKDKPLVLQYEVKMQKGLECGGAYLKLLTKSATGINAEEFSGDTPYTIMFGPDKCGATNKVHFIFRHKNPVTGEYEEKHLRSPPVARISKISTLYTLIVRPDQTFSIKINDKEVKKGSLLEDFTPAVNPDKEIDDVEDKKPSDWVDEAKIDDPEATKPADWDEDAPLEIEDNEAEMPANWHEDEPATIADPDAAKPADWDDEEDGTWLAPQIDNPKCVGPDAGCGPWKRPLKRNPDYKGKWFAPKIDNPLYKGVWAPRKINNPSYFEDKKPANFEPMEGLGFELWTMQADILFDNIVVSHEESDASELAKDWKAKFVVEEAEDNATTAKASEAAQKNYDDLFPRWETNKIGFLKQQVLRFVSIAQVDPIHAAKTMPETAGALIAALVTLLLVLLSTLGLIGGTAAKAASSSSTQNKKQVTNGKTSVTLKSNDAATSPLAGNPAPGEATVSATPLTDEKTTVRSRKA